MWLVGEITTGLSLKRCAGASEGDGMPLQGCGLPNGHILHEKNSVEPHICFPMKSLACSPHSPDLHRSWVPPWEMTLLYGSMTFMSIRCSCSPITTVLHSRLSSRSSSAVYSGIDSDSWPELLLAVASSGREAQSGTEAARLPQEKQVRERIGSHLLP